MTAVKRGNFKAVRSLLIGKAKKDLTPKFGPFAGQPIQASPLIADLLNDSDPSTYCDLGYFNVAEEGQDFQFRDGDPNALNSRKETALFVACKCDEYDWIRTVWHPASQQSDIKAGKSYILILFDFYNENFYRSRKAES